MKKFVVIALLVLSAFSMATPAHARVAIGLGFGLPAYGYAPTYYATPAPVYYYAAPPVVYATPASVPYYYAAPAPAYYR